MKYLLFAILLMSFFCILSCAESPKYKDADLSVDQRVEDLLSRMTLDEKLGEMYHPRLDVGENSKLDTTFAEEMIVDVHVTHFLNNGKARPAYFAKWSNDVQKLAAHTRLGIPVIFSSDPRWEWLGCYTALGATWNPELIHEYAHQRAKAFRAIGLHVGLHPVAGVATEPRWTRVFETFGESAYLVAKMNEAYISGFQGKTIDKNSVICMSKHFPGEGAEKDGIDNHGPRGQEMVYPGDNFSYHLFPWHFSISRAATGAIMPGYAIPVGFDSVAINFSKLMITTILQEKLGFDGVICSDWGVVDQRHYGVDKILGGELEMSDWHGILKVPGMTDQQVLENTHRIMLEAGVDQFGIWDWDGNEIKALRTLLQTGQISEQRIDKSVRRILKCKFQLGLFDNPYVDPAEAERIVNDETQFTAKQGIERQSIVLLKNNGLLPLSKTKKPAFFFSVEGKMPTNNSVKKAASAENSDVVFIKVRGAKNNYINLEPQNGLLLPDSALQRIERAMKTDKPVILSIIMQNPVIIPQTILQRADAIIVEWNDNIDAVIDVVFGDLNPSGKLPHDLPASIESAMNQLEDVPFDMKEITFPFGFGLSYTTFKYSNLEITAQKSATSDVQISFTITNTGKVKGADVAQIYFIEPDKPKTLRLRGFQKVTLEPGQSQNVSLQLNADDMGSYDENFQFGVAPGKRKVFVARSRTDVRLKGKFDL